MTIIVVLFFIIWLAGQVVPWIMLRSRGLRLSFLEYGSPLIRKNILAFAHNNKVFEALQLIKNNKLDVNIIELQKIYDANMNFNEFVDALVLAKNRNVNVSKDVLWELAYFKKDLVSIINATNAGESVVPAHIIQNYVIQKTAGALV